MSGFFKRTQKRCGECLFSDNKLVSDERREDIVRTCVSKGTYFVCHKHSMVGADVACRGFLEALPGYVPNMVQIARRLSGGDESMVYDDVPFPEESPVLVPYKDHPRGGE